MNYFEKSLKKHYEWQGKIEVVCRVPVSNSEELSIAYTPGVAQPCLEIQKDKDKSFELTRRSNLVAVITDGTAVLGLGDIGPEAGMPVMEGKCALFKAFADIDAFPLCIRSKNTDEIVRTIELLSGSFGGINLEDISAPRCFEIERKLKEVCDIPIFHDDQHGTAVVASAALINAMKLTGRRLSDIKIVVNGVGAAGTAIIKLLIALGAENIIACDKVGIISCNNEMLPPEKMEVAEITNKARQNGSLADAMRGGDVFIGVSAPDCVTPDMVRSMAPDPLLFPMANPVPEIMPDLAIKAGAAIVGTGRSDFPNQINNVLAFPGIFRGALDVRASVINEEMIIAAANAVAECVTDDKLSADFIIPSALDKSVAFKVAAAIAAAARKSGAARI